MLQLPPLSLYIHVPWCIRKCPYCDFNSHKADEKLPEKEYVEALLNDLDQDKHWVQQREIESIFIGGGTPSLLSADAYEKLFDELQQRLTFATDIEITLEANPGTFEAEKFKEYRKLGINRLSMGIQSFQPHQLQQLGRVHDRDQALNAIAQAQTAGFDNFNLDLMHGLPHQSVAEALDDLTMALSFKPPHLSWYQLTIEPNTEFYKRPPRLPEDDTLWDIQQAGFECLAKQGFEHYEISAFSQPGKASRHNLNYWQFGDYIGIGAGAHGKITQTKTNTIIRTHKTRLPRDYLNPEKTFLAGQHSIDSDERGLECLMNGLRLREGISVEQFKNYTGLSLESLAEPLERGCQLGLLVVDKRIYATAKGQQYLNDVLALFFK